MHTLDARRGELCEQLEWLQRIDGEAGVVPLLETHDLAAAQVDRRDQLHAPSQARKLDSMRRPAAPLFSG